MITGSGIEIPADLFKTIDRVHKKSTAIYNTIDKEALELVSPNRKLDSDKLKNDSKNKSIKPR